MICAALLWRLLFGVLLALFGAAGTNAAPSFAGWTYRQTVDDFTDETESMALSPTISGRPFRTAVLRVGCNQSIGVKGQVRAWVNLGYFNNIGSKYRLNVKFDDDAPKTVGIHEWSGTRGFSFQGVSLAWFIRELAHKSRLRIQTS